MHNEVRESIHVLIWHSIVSVCVRVCVCLQVCEKDSGRESRELTRLTKVSDLTASEQVLTDPHADIIVWITHSTVCRATRDHSLSD